MSPDRWSRPVVGKGGCPVREEGMEEMIVKPREAATLILLRQAPPEAGGLEVLMVLRHPKSPFVPRAFVFPGGTLDREDCSGETAERLAGMTREKAWELLEDCPSPEIALGSWVTAIRETFEEAGILLARDARGEWVRFRGNPDRERYCHYRRLLSEGKITFSHFLENENLTLAGDGIHYFSHWITPEYLPLRYDVRFFVAPAPPGQKAVHDGVELTGHVWISPREALERFRSGTFDMVLPTLMTMEELASYETPEDVFRAAEKKAVRGILTRMEETDEGIVEYLPDGRAFKNLPPSM